MKELQRIYKDDLHLAISRSYLSSAEQLYYPETIGILVLIASRSAELGFHTCIKYGSSSRQHHNRNRHSLRPCRPNPIKPPLPTQQRGLQSPDLRRRQHQRHRARRQDARAQSLGRKARAHRWGWGPHPRPHHRRWQLPRYRCRAERGPWQATYFFAGGGAQ